ncbi:MAG TPA: hypothetical protein PLO28_10595, partial [bacterium]|nr:hypothetical protein [bacterium]
DERRESISVSLPMALQGTARLYDHLGEGKALENIRREGGMTLIPEIVLEGGAVCIIHIEK